MQWSEVVETWIADGLITDEQAPALKDWLETNKPPSAPLSDLALTVVAMVGAWLLSGASVLLTVQLELDVHPGAVALLGGLGWAAIGIAVGQRVSPAAGQGLVAAAVVIATLALLGLFEDRPGNLDAAAVAATLVPAAAGTLVGVLRRQSTVAVASSMAAAMVLSIWVYDQSRWAETLFGLTLVLAVLPNALAYKARLDDDDWLAAVAGTLQSQVAFATVIGINAAFARNTWGSSQNAWLWESAFTVTLFGIGLLGAGAVGASRLTLVSGVAALVTAEIAVLTAFGDVVAAIVILGLEGLALIAAVVVVVASRAGKARRAQDGGERRLSG